MTKPAAFQATYSDWRLIKTRKVVQLCFEVPVEQAGLAYDVLGGMPNFGSEVWCAIARLKQPKENEAQPRPPVTESPSATTGGAQSRRPFTSLPLPQQAGMMCQEPTFQKFLKEKLFGIFIQYEGLGEDDQVAATMVRDFCGVQSRADLNTNNEAAIKWRGLVSDYRAYMLEPAVTG